MREASECVGRGDKNICMTRTACRAIGLVSACHWNPTLHLNQRIERVREKKRPRRDTDGPNADRNAASRSRPCRPPAARGADGGVVDGNTTGAARVGDTDTPVVTINTHRDAKGKTNPRPSVWVSAQNEDDEDRTVENERKRDRQSRGKTKG